MTSRSATLLGFALIAAVALVLVLVSRRSDRLRSFGDLMTFVLRHWPARFLLVVLWLWLGWHIFVRVDWR